MKQRYTLYKRYTDNNKQDFSWYFCYYDEAGKRIYKATGKKKKYEAVAFIEEFLELKDNTPQTLNDYTKTFFLWEQCNWIKRQHAKGKSFTISVAKFRRSHLDNYILPKFGKRRMDSLNRVEIENWLIGLKNYRSGVPLSNQSKNHILYTFRIVLREVERERLIPFNCLGTVESLALRPKARDVFTKEELNRLFPADIKEMKAIWGRKEYAYLFYVLATTGMRSGEVRALQWKHIIWDETCNGLFVERAVKDNDEFGTTKTGFSRVVLLTTRANECLKDWLDETPFDQMNDLIFFGQERNRPTTRKNLSLHFQKALQRTQIDRNLVIHSFRHTYNTLLEPVLPKETLQALTGHRTDEMTERYNHPDINKRLRILTTHAISLDKIFS